MWSDNETKIRRFLRDPDANIWTRSFLRRAFNDAQVDFCGTAGLLETIEAIRIPPEYNCSYNYDWEWRHITGSKNYQALIYHHPGGFNVCCFSWEVEHLGFSAGSGTDIGYAFTHPWEAYMVSDVNKPVPAWFPEQFEKALFVAFDKDPLLFTTKKKVQSGDQSWLNHTGDPQYYFRNDTESNELYLYPRPPVVWQDVDGAGMVISTSGDTESSETGTILDLTGAIDNQNDGISTAVITAENNLLMIYEAHPTDIKELTDESDYPVFLQKYIEYATLEKAYSANTDGRIGSLGDYWGWRKQMGLEFIKKFRWNRYADRDFRLISQGAGSSRQYRGPRLPDEYPNVR